MRLTLRTLLAWLDDTLSPGEVREIGKQVGDSPFAKELVDKIHKVTRQRRLTVPPRSGPESVDANVVARYLDNELDAEEVTELEKRCLASDVHLAEVASVHQILSLIGQKAKVPVEARNRMYHLVKGRESVKPPAPKSPRRSEPKKVAEPISPWVTPSPPARPWVKQFGPAALVLAMIAVLGLTAWKSMSLPDPTTPIPDTPLAVRTPVRTAEPQAADEKPAPKGVEPTDPGVKDQAGKTAADAAKPVEKVAVTPEKESPEPTRTEDPYGGVGHAKKPTGVLLRYSPARREWERLTEPSALHEQDRLLSLAPFRSTLEIGPSGIDLVGETEVWVGANAPSLAAKLSLSQGRVVLHGGPSATPFEVQFGGKSVKITPPPGGTVGIERLNRRGQGEPMPSSPVLKLYAADGTVSLSDGTSEETFKGPGSVTFDSRGKFTDKSSKPVPTWVSETGLTAFEENLGEQYLKFFRPGRQVVSDLVEAYDDENKDIIRYAISALRAVGDVSFIVPLLNTVHEKNAATKRRAAIQVLRAYLAEGPDAFKKLDKYLQDELGGDLTPKVEKLLVGFTPKEAAEEATYSRLIQYLSGTDDSDVCVRELALDNLQELTGRDSLDYDPEKPDGKGLKAWKDLNHSHELRPATGSLKAAK